MNRRTTSLIATILVPMLMAAPSGASARKQAMLMALTANSKQATQYQLKQKITVVRKGQPLEPTIQEVSFDANGQPLRLTLSKPAEKKMGPIKARKVSEIKESVQETMQIAFRYASPQQLAAAIQNGELWEGPSEIRIVARSASLPGDETTVTVNPATFLAGRVDVKTRHEGDPVHVAIFYEQFPSGPSMMRRMTVQMPEEDIVVNVESFDFVRLAGPTIH